MSFLLLLVAAVLSILGWIGDNDSLSTAGWVVWLIGILLLLLRWWRNRRKFASVEHARAAAEAGDPRAMRALASIHKLGEDHAEAERLLRAAIELGDVEAMWDMGGSSTSGTDSRRPSRGSGWPPSTATSSRSGCSVPVTPSTWTARVPCEPGGGRTTPPGPGTGTQMPNRTPVLFRRPHGLPNVYV